METIIDSQLPEFEAQAFYEGRVKMVSHQDLLGKWSVLFFYYADFSETCKNELADLIERYDTLRSLGLEVYSISTDSIFVHKAWYDASPTIREIRFPMISDPTGKLTQAFGILNEEEGMAYRSTFVIDPEGKIKICEINTVEIERDADELVRKIKAAQFIAKNTDQVCPAKWHDGEPTLKPRMDLVGKI